MVQQHCQMPGKTVYSRTVTKFVKFFYLVTKFEINTLSVIRSPVFKYLKLDRRAIYPLNTTTSDSSNTMNKFKKKNRIKWILFWSSFIFFAVLHFFSISNFLNAIIDFRGALEKGKKSNFFYLEHIPR